MGRSLRVTADHPGDPAGGEFEIVLAHEIAEGDELLALCELPAVEPAKDFDLIERLRGTELEQDVHVSPVDDSFTALYEQYAGSIPRSFLKHPEEIRKHNRMPLGVDRHLTEQGVLNAPHELSTLHC